MWNRLTVRAKEAIFHAQEEAEEMGTNKVGTEHLLLGLMREPQPSIAHSVLLKLGIDLEQLRRHIEGLIPLYEPPNDERPTMTPRAKFVIHQGYEEARYLGDNFIGTEHILIGLIREGKGVGGRALTAMGVELDKAREVLLELRKKN